MSSQSDATSAIKQAQASLKQEAGRGKADNDDSGSSDDEGVHADDGPTGDEHDDALLDSKVQSNQGRPAEGTSIAQDVIGRQGQYGRFAERWFSRKGWKTEGRRAQGMSSEAHDRAQMQTTPAEEATSLVSPVAEAQGIANVSAEEDEDIVKQQNINKAPKDKTEVDITSTLLPKLLSTTKMLLSSHSFFFSYDYDITRRMGTQRSRKGYLPLHKCVDPLVGVRYYP